MTRLAGSAPRPGCRRSSCTPAGAGLGEPPRSRALPGGAVNPGGVGRPPSPLDAPQPPAAFKGRRGRRGAPRGRRREGRGHRRGAAGSGRGPGRSRPRGGGRAGPGVEPRAGGSGRGGALPFPSAASRSRGRRLRNSSCPAGAARRPQHGERGRRAGSSAPARPALTASPLLSCRSGKLSRCSAPCWPPPACEPR